MNWISIVFRSGLILFVILIIAIYTGGCSSIPEALVAWGTILLAFTTYLSVKENHEQGKRERKKGLLLKIIEWQEEIQYASLVQFPLNIEIGIDIPLKFNKLINYSKALAKGNNIIQLIKYPFKDDSDLMDKVKNLRDNLVAILYLNRLEINQKNPMEYSNYQDAFSSELLGNIDAINLSIENGEKLDDLLAKYSQDLGSTTGNLSDKISKLLTDL